MMMMIMLMVIKMMMMMMMAMTFSSYTPSPSTGFPRHSWCYKHPTDPTLSILAAIAITTKAKDEKYDAAVKFMQYVTSDEAMQIWLDVVGELPAKPSVGLTDANVSNDVFGPFIRGLENANTTKFVNESAQRQIMVDMVARINLEGASVAEALAEAAAAEQKLLDDFYAAN